MNTSHLENEHHVLFECDLYANIRSKLIRTLNNTMGKIDCNLEICQKNTLEHAFRAINVSNLSKHILEIHSNCESYLAPIAAGINQNTLVNPRDASYHATINHPVRQDNCNVSKNEQFILFADDTNIFVKAKTEAETIDLANKILQNVSRYMLVNKLHINLGKCCYMKFKPISNTETNLEDRLIKIGETPIKQVSETKFLGIIIDDKLTWNPQIQYLRRKLSSSIGILNRIKDSIPISLHKNLYHTLFESHLCYGITSWGGVTESKLQPLFKIQKRCIRILFGNKEKYLNKFKTCCRVRPVEEQILGQEHYEKDHTKPLLNKHNLMTVHNLYVYHCSMDTFKTLKYRIPISLYSLYLLSNRKEAFLITPLPNSQFIYNASKIWNTIRETIAKSDLSISICSLKSTLKKHIISLQKFGTFYEWDNQKTFIFS